jgi:hypothetical protein
MPSTFPFYNQGSPIPTTKNTINNIAGTVTNSGIRDFLLKLNIGGSSTPPTMFYNITPTGVISPKIGEPFLDTSVNNNVNQVPNFSPIEQYGITWKNVQNINLNQFQNTSTTADDLINLPDYIPQTTNGPINNGLTTFTFGNTYFPLGANSVLYPNKTNEDIDNFGLLAKTTFADFKNLSTLKNLYNPTALEVDTSKGIDNPSVTFSYLAAHKNAVQNEGYLDQNGALNQGGGAGIEAANILGSVFNGGLGIGGNGAASTNFDIRSSLVGRVLGATGTIKDSNLGIIGGQQLALALANNAAFNVQQDIIGKLNIQDNVLSLIKGNGLAGFRPNYQITVPSSGVGKFFEGAGKILGFTLPRSFISDDASIFASENGHTENIQRANALIVNTGKGQFVSLIKNATASIQGTGGYDDPTYQPFRSGYAPGYRDNKGIKQINGDNIYAYSNGEGNLINPLDSCDGVIPDLSFQREIKAESSGFKSFNDYHDSQNNINYVAKTWVSKTGGTVNATEDGNINDYYSTTSGVKKSLLDKTQKLFDSTGMLNMVSAKGNIGVTPSQIQTTNGGGMSKGSAVLKKELFSKEGLYEKKKLNAESTYARSWTTHDRYDKVSKLIRHKGLDPLVPYRNQIEGSVLDDNGFVKIAPYVDVAEDPKKFMFSIENLAWNDEYFNLLPCERGTGDLLTGKKGRIMWFPPYDIQFSENSSVEWESNKFIGRGESVYTYSNTERSGTLSFKVVVDHSTYTNSFAGNRGGNNMSPDDNYVASFFAGEISPDASFSDKMTSYELDEVLLNYTPTTEVQNAETVKKPTDELNLFFPNDVYTYYADYENGIGGGIGYIAGQATSKRNYNDNTDYGLNSKFTFKGTTYTSFTESATAIATYLAQKDNAAIIVNVKGSASITGQNTANDALASKRADTAIGILKSAFKTANVKDVDKKVRKISNIVEEIGCDAGTNDQNDISCKKARKAIVSFDIDYNLIADKTNFDITKTTTTVTTKNPFYGECSFFEKLKETDSFVFDKFRDKIKYFHPAFHSTTPEGLNSRLTFLLQCTRQGPTLEKQGANNLAFGRPPVCILRIGDFYNTKIVIDSISIDYEPLVWDLNPEGIGVQPMIANVNMSFKFIGGSTLLGPINKLQNALSFNYFANTQVYDVRADYLAKVKNPANAQKPNSDYELHNKAFEVFGNNLNKGVSVTTGLIKNEFFDSNQVKCSDDTTNGVQETQTSGTTGTVTALTDVTTLLIGDKYQIKVNLSFDGLTQNSTDNELNDFLLKGLKIRIESMVGVLLTEELVLLSDPIYKSIKELILGHGFYLGNIIETNSYLPKIIISQGNYMIKVIYDGLPLFNKNFSIV